MEIKEVKKYEVEGKTYNCISDVATHVEDKLGNLIDVMLPNVGPKIKLELFTSLVKNRRELNNILGTTFEADADDLLYEGKFISIFEFSRRSREYKKEKK